jgi:hypothetical protein
MATHSLSYQETSSVDYQERTLTTDISENKEFTPSKEEASASGGYIFSPIFNGMGALGETIRCVFWSIVEYILPCIPLARKDKEIAEGQEEIKNLRGRITVTETNLSEKTKCFDELLAAHKDIKKSLKKLGKENKLMFDQKVSLTNNLNDLRNDAETLRISKSMYAALEPALHLAREYANYVEQATFDIENLEEQIANEMLTVENLQNRINDFESASSLEMETEEKAVPANDPPNQENSDSGPLVDSSSTVSANFVNTGGDNPPVTVVANLIVPDDGAQNVNDAVVNDAVVNDAVVNDAVVNDAVVNDAVVNDAVVNDAVVNDVVVNDVVIITI